MKLRNWFVLTLILTLLIPSNVMAATNSSDDNQPLLKITEVSQATFDENEEATLEVTIENIGYATAYDLNVALNITDGTPIENLDTISNQYVEILQPNGETTLSFSIRVDAEIEEGFYPVVVSGTYKDTDNSSYTLSETLSLSLLDALSEPDFEVTLATGESILEDDQSTIKFVLSNKGDGAEDVTVAFADNADVGVYVIGDDDRYLADFASGKNVTFSMELLSDEGVSGYLPLDFEVTYTRGGRKITDTVTTYVTVVGEASGDLIVESVTTSNNSLSAGETTTISVVITNDGEGSIEDISVGIGDSTALVPVSQNQFVVQALAAGESKTLTFKLMAEEMETSMYYTVPLTISYEDETISQYAGAYVIGTEEDEDVVTKPRVVVTKFETSEDKIYVGDTFDLSFEVTNTSLLKDIRNVKVVLETGSSEDGAFLPVGTSNSFFIANLGTGAGETINVPLKVFANATGKSYTMTINFEYEDEDGNLYEDSESVIIPVYEQVELTISDVSVGEQLDSGYTLEVDFYNTGKVDITNMMVDLDSDLVASNSNYYVGDFATGRTDVYDVEIVGTMPSVITGTIVFTFDDTFGENVTIEKEFTIDNASSGSDTGFGGGGTMGMNGGGFSDLTDEERTAMMESGDFPGRPSDTTTESAIPWIPIIGGSAGLLVVAVVAILLVIKRRKAKNG